MSSTTLIGPSGFGLPSFVNGKPTSQTSVRSISGEGYTTLSTPPSTGDSFHKRAKPKPVSARLNNPFEIFHPAIKRPNPFGHMLVSPLPPKELAEILKITKQLIGRDDHHNQNNRLPALKEMMILARPILEALQSQPNNAKLVIYQKEKNGSFIIEKELYKPESSSPLNALIRHMLNFMVASRLKLVTENPLKDPQRVVKTVNRHVQKSVDGIFNPKQSHIKKLATVVLDDVAKPKSTTLSKDLLVEFLIPEREYLASVSDRLDYDLKQPRQLKEFVNQVVKLFRSIDEHARPLLKNSGNPQMRYRLGVATVDPNSQQIIVHPLDLEKPH